MQILIISNYNGLQIVKNYYLVTRKLRLRYVDIETKNITEVAQKPKYGNIMISLGAQIVDI